MESHILDKVSWASDCNSIINVEDLIRYDQFHIGGHRATKALFKKLAPKVGDTILDLGCGIGGVSRFFAHYGQLSVVGVDVDADFVALAKKLSTLSGLGAKTTYARADATDFIAPDVMFDYAVLVHVGMGIEDKCKLLRNAHKQLIDNGKILIYDVLLLGDSDLGRAQYPLPWADNHADGHLRTKKYYENKLIEAGFNVISCEKERVFTQKIIENPPPQDVTPFTGEDFHTRLVNLRHFLAHKIGCPYYIIAEKI